MKKLLVAACMLLAGCVAIGQKFDSTQVDYLQPGVSTMADAKTRLGEPTGENQTPAGTVLSWRYTRGSPFGATVEQVMIAFDRDGKMTRVLARAKSKS